MDSIPGGLGGKEERLGRGGGLVEGGALASFPCYTRRVELGLSTGALCVDLQC